MKYTVNDSCIGCGVCAELCPDVFRLEDDGLRRQALDRMIGEQMTVARSERLVEELLAGRVGYHRREGQHFLSYHDWEAYMDFGDLHRAETCPETR